MNRLPNLLLLASLLSAPAAPAPAPAPEQSAAPIRVLLVVAHPDDEYAMAGTAYRIAKELSGTVDQLIITNGEAGFRYASLAEPYYGVELTDESVGRARLPRIRREEAQHAGRILGIRHQWFLNQKDEHFTLSAEEVLDKSWQEEAVEEAIVRRLREGHYGFVIVLLPTEDTHGGHKAAAIVTLQAVQQFSPGQRPVVLGAEALNGDLASYRPLPNYSLTATTSSQPPFHFDRDARFGYGNSLSYQIVVDWVIAEHKSQGLFQTKCRQDRFEGFWIFSVSGKGATEATASLFNAISHRAKVGEQDGIAKSGH